MRALSDYELETMGIGYFRRMPVNGRLPEILFSGAAAAYLKISTTTLLKGAKNGRFPGENRGGSIWAFQRKDLHAFLKTGRVACSLFTSEDDARTKILLMRYKEREFAKRAASRKALLLISNMPPRPTNVNKSSKQLPYGPLRPADLDPVTTDEVSHPSAPAVLTVAEVAAYLRVSKPTVVRMAKSGELPGRRVGTLWRFSRDAISAFI